MKKLSQCTWDVIAWFGFWGAVLALAIFALSSDAEADILKTDSMPLDPLLQCAANAMRIYELPPRIAISVGCYEQIDALEQWSVQFMERTGLTIHEVEYIVSEASAE